jgi:hypothetical protein
MAMKNIIQAARRMNGHIDTEGGVLCPLCFEFGSEYRALKVVSAELPCYNCNENPAKHCQCHKFGFEVDKS